MAKRGKDGRKTKKTKENIKKGCHCKMSAQCTSILDSFPILLRGAKKGQKWGSNAIQDVKKVC